MSKEQKTQNLKNISMEINHASTIILDSILGKNPKSEDDFANAGKEIIENKKEEFLRSISFPDGLTGYAKSLLRKAYENYLNSFLKSSNEGRTKTGAYVMIFGGLQDKNASNVRKAFMSYFSKGIEHLSNEADLNSLLSAMSTTDSTKNRMLEKVKGLEDLENFTSAEDLLQKYPYAFVYSDSIDKIKRKVGVGANLSSVLQEENENNKATAKSIIDTGIIVGIRPNFELTEEIYKSLLINDEIYTGLPELPSQDDICLVPKDNAVINVNTPSKPQRKSFKSFWKSSPKLPQQEFEVDSQTKEIDDNQKVRFGDNDLGSIFQSSGSSDNIRPSSNPTSSNESPKANIRVIRGSNSLGRSSRKIDGAIRGKVDFSTMFTPEMAASVDIVSNGDSSSSSLQQSSTSSLSSISSSPDKSYSDQVRSDRESSNGRTSPK